MIITINESNHHLLIERDTALYNAINAAVCGSPGVLNIKIQSTLKFKQQKKTTSKSQTFKNHKEVDFKIYPHHPIYSK